MLAIGLDKVNSNLFCHHKELMHQTVFHFHTHITAGTNAWFSHDKAGLIQNIKEKDSSKENIATSVINEKKDITKQIKATNFSNEQNEESDKSQKAKQLECSKLEDFKLTDTDKICYEDKNFFVTYDRQKDHKINLILVPQKTFSSFNDFMSKSSPSEVSSFYDTIRKIV